MKSSPSIWHLLHKLNIITLQNACQIDSEIASIFVVFLENLNFNHQNFVTFLLPKKLWMISREFYTYPEIKVGFLPQKSATIRL